MPSGRAHYLLKKGAKLHRSKGQSRRYSANLDILNNDGQYGENEMNIDSKSKMILSKPKLDSDEEEKYHN